MSDIKHTVGVWVARLDAMSLFLEVTPERISDAELVTLRSALFRTLIDTQQVIESRREVVSVGEPAVSMIRRSSHS